MKRMSLLKGLWLCRQYQGKGLAERKQIQQQRLLALVNHARAHSPYYRELYAALKEPFDLADLPPVNKVELMAHFDRWITDPDIRSEEVLTFMQDLDNVGRRLKGKYLVFSTSGSTGNPLITLCDQSTYNVMAAINMLRSFARKEDLRAFLKRGGKTMGVFATGGFYLGNGSVRARLHAMPWKKKQLALTSALLPLSQIVAELNAFQPAMLGGYPTQLELLIEEQLQGRLQLSPVLVMTGGEYLSDELRQRLSQAFGCYVQTSYSCTEGGPLANECRETHFHLNNDWVLVEPVDRHNRPVPPGVQSDKILLTNLYNYTQPFIRYEITDRVVLHEELCPCGNPSPWLTLEGRTDDVVSFWEAGREIRIAPLALYATLKEVHQVQRFQLVAGQENQVSLRLIPAAGQEKQAAFEAACQSLRAFLRQQGVSQVQISLSPELPKQHPQSGKFKHIINKMA